MKKHEIEDKSKWGDGPWQDEPDELFWVDEATGLHCAIQRGPVGALCGYVAVPRGHQDFGMPYNNRESDDSLDVIYDVHGGLTFSGWRASNVFEAVIGKWWVGFDCAHCNDLMPGLDARMKEIMGEHRSMGEYRTIDYVKAECASLARQINQRGYTQ